MEITGTTAVLLLCVGFVFGVQQDEALARSKRNTCTNCNTQQQLCKWINVQNKWVIDAANCVSYCVRSSNQNTGGYCQQETCYCNKGNTGGVGPTTSLCENIMVNGKWVVDAAKCVSYCVRSSSDNTGGYCQQNTCSCSKGNKPTTSLCENIMVNGKWVVDAAKCVSYCVRSSSDNTGGYCQQNTCSCSKGNKPTTSLCENIMVNGKWVVDASKCVSYCVRSSSDNTGGYCQQNVCSCSKQLKEPLPPQPQPLCKTVWVNNKWVTDPSACANYCVKSTNGFKKIGYCQGNTCYCK